MRVSTAAVLLFSGAVKAWDEHAGEVFSKIAGSSMKCGSGVQTGTNSSGVFQDVGGVNTYIAYPPGPVESRSNATAILYLTDIFGLPLVNNRLLGDSLAQAGYFVVMPDLFAGEASMCFLPRPLSILNADMRNIVKVEEFGTPEFNMTAWSARHTAAAVDPIVESLITTMRGSWGVTKIGAVGYCFGGKYVTRFLAEGKGLDAGFTAHPSSVVAAEYEGITKPLSIAYGQLDGANTPTQRAAAETIFQSKNATYQTSLYSNAEHGFAVRTDLSVPMKKFAQEAAYFQAVNWFDHWVKG
ncbi:hypothetical protein HYFRA_00013158 [Hymenoscyphus fraxineus]|uniref:Dienelactone hydrolase domain-containing protein n=1 Tax=Hymenoscyphus fraxineus TaxID=746836 RepID=A0A9N9PU54_9HELO|nr:hypothetical protein HYFRA_00013158 [Hymenoscyphus fraxineus]